MCYNQHKIVLIEICNQDTVDTWKREIIKEIYNSSIKHLAVMLILEQLQ